MSRTPIRSKPTKPNTNRKIVRGQPFDPAVFLATAGVGREISKHPKKAIIFTQGDVADAVFYIKKGKIKVAVISDQGNEAIVALLGENEFVGEGCLLGQPKRLATASALTECETMRVSKIEIQRVLRDEPTFSQMFVSHILARNARVEEDLVDQLFNSTEKRLARLLLGIEHDGAGAITEQHAGSTVAPVENPREGLRADHQRALERAGAQEVVGGGQREHKARTYRL